MITILLTDIEGSTDLASRTPEAYRQVLARHFEIMRAALLSFHGQEFLETGDGLYAAFEVAENATSCASLIQSQLEAEEWPSDEIRIRVRMGLDRGMCQFRDGQYRGLPMHRTARLCAAGAGGRIICSSGVFDAIQKSQVRRLGTYRLRGFPQSEPLYEILWREGLEPKPLRASHARTHNLPQTQGTLFGRSAELQSLRPKLTAGASLTLIGPGGMGKTRLALELARENLEKFDHAVAYVPLVDVSEASRLMDSIREALGILPDPLVTAEIQVVEALNETPTLLLLDNFEHLLPDGSARVRRLQKACPNLCLLTTSRLPMGLPGEQSFRISPLEHKKSTPSDDWAQSPSVGLFMERAQAADSDFAITITNRQAIADLCSVLEGVPLAIELAAVKVSLFSPSEILDQISKSVKNLEISESPGRHHSLHATIGWSYDSLPSRSQRVFSALSVFRGGWTLDSAVAVAALEEPKETHFAIQNLRSSALITAREGFEGLRFFMLETIRQYGSEKLEGSADEHYQRHWKFFSNIAYQSQTVLYEQRKESTLLLLDSEHENMLAALDHARTPSHRLRLATALEPYWNARDLGHQHRRRLVRPTGKKNDVDDRVLADALSSAGLIDMRLGHLQRARVCFKRSQVLSEKLGLDVGASIALHNLSLISIETGDFEEAVKQLEANAVLFEEMKDTIKLGCCLNSLGICLMKLDRRADAELALERSQIVLHGVENDEIAALTKGNLGYFYYVMGRINEAVVTSFEALQICTRLNNRSAAINILLNLSHLFASHSDYSNSARLVGAGLGIMSRLRIKPNAMENASILTLSKRGRTHLDGLTFDQLMESGQSLDLPQIVSLIRLSELAKTYRLK